MLEHHAIPLSRLEAVLDRRTAELARPPAVEDRGPGLSVLAFSFAGGLYGVPLRAVSEVLPGRTPVRWPGGPASVLGLVGHAGRAIVVLDLARLLGTSSHAPEGPGMLIVLARHERRLALAVQRANGVLSVEDPLDGPIEAVRWAAIRDGGPGMPSTLALLDPASLDVRPSTLARPPALPFVPGAPSTPAPSALPVGV